MFIIYVLFHARPLRMLDSERFFLVDHEILCGTDEYTYVLLHILIE
jgi:hypothetical protein